MTSSNSFVTIRSYSPRDNMHTSTTVPIAIPVDHKMQRVFSSAVLVQTQIRAQRTPSPSQQQEINQFPPPISPGIQKQNELLEKMLSSQHSNEKLSFVKIYENRSPEERAVFQKFMQTLHAVQGYKEQTLIHKRKPEKPDLQLDRTDEMLVDAEICALMGEPKKQKHISNTERQIV